MRIGHRDLYESFASHEVRYLVIGGVAAIGYGVPRSTRDLDILIDATPENAAALLTSLREVGLGTAFLIEAQELLDEEITVFADVIRLDVQTRTPGLDFEEAWERRNVVSFEGAPVILASLQDLIASKEAAGRPVDLEDAEILRKIAAEQNAPDSRPA